MSEASWSGLSNSGADGKQKIKVWSKGSENLQQVILYSNKLLLSLTPC
jgi:hypothetical protein